MVAARKRGIHIVDLVAIDFGWQDCPQFLGRLLEQFVEVQIQQLAAAILPLERLGPADSGELQFPVIVDGLILVGSCIGWIQ